MKIQKALVFLDTMFDTRLGCIAKVNPSVAAKIATDAKLMAKYIGRANDDMSKFGIDQKTYKEEWDKRNAMLLPACTATCQSFLLGKLIAQMEISTEHQPHLYDGFEVHLNIWPYGNMSDEVKQTLSMMFQKSSGLANPVKIVDIPITALTPALITTEQYSTVLIYDIDPWLTHHFHGGLTDEEMIERSIPHVLFLSGFLIPDLDRFKELYEFRNPAGEQCPPHIGMSKLLEPFVGIQYIGLIHYSLPTPKDFIGLELVREQARNRSNV